MDEHPYNYKDTDIVNSLLGEAVEARRTNEYNMKRASEVNRLADLVTKALKGKPEEHAMTRTEIKNAISRRLVLYGYPVLKESEVDIL